MPASGRRSGRCSEANKIVQGSKFKVQGSRSKFKVQGSRFKVKVQGFKVQSLRFKNLQLLITFKITMQQFNNSTIQQFNDLTTIHNSPFTIP